MYSFTKREQVGILIIVFTLGFALFFKFLVLDKVSAKKQELEIINREIQLEALEESKAEDFVEDAAEDTTIMIHISGQVHSPGLIELEYGQRLKDAVEYAGGLKNDADIDKINLAKKLSDEDKIYIPKIGEEIDDILDISVESSQATSTGSSGKININTCTKESLISLPGIGEVTAEKIINYREENSFNTIEDIKNVSGIGDKKFEAIKDLIATK